MGNSDRGFTTLILFRLPDELELADWVADMTLIFVYNERRDPAAEKWMKKRAVRNYYDALEKLRLVEMRCSQE